MRSIRGTIWERVDGDSLSLKYGGDCTITRFSRERLIICVSNGAHFPFFVESDLDGRFVFIGNDSKHKQHIVNIFT